MDGARLAALIQQYGPLPIARAVGEFGRTIGVALGGSDGLDGVPEVERRDPRRPLPAREAWNLLHWSVQMAPGMALFRRHPQIAIPQSEHARRRATAAREQAIVAVYERSPDAKYWPGWHAERLAAARQRLAGAEAALAALGPDPTALAVEEAILVVNAPPSHRARYEQISAAEPYPVHVLTIDTAPDIPRDLPDFEDRAEPEPAGLLLSTDPGPLDRLRDHLGAPDPDPLSLIHFASDSFRTKLFAALAAVQVALTRATLPYIAFSSGKDSLVVAALVHRIDPSVLLVWSDDELEYPETIAYMAALREAAGPYLLITLGYAAHAGWFQPWRDDPPWRQPFMGAVRLDELVEPAMVRGGYDMAFTGLRAEESGQRRQWLRSVRVREGAGMVYWAKTDAGPTMRCTPIWDWSSDDVWALIHGWRLPSNAVYDRLTALDVPRHRQRVGPLPLAPRPQLAEGWPELLADLEARYGARWR